MIISQNFLFQNTVGLFTPWEPEPLKCREPERKGAPHHWFLYPLCSFFFSGNVFVVLWRNFVKFLIIFPGFFRRSVRIRTSKFWIRPFFALVYSKSTHENWYKTWIYFNKLMRSKIKWCSLSRFWSNLTKNVQCWEC